MLMNNIDYFIRKFMRKQGKDKVAKYCFLMVKRNIDDNIDEFKVQVWKQTFLVSQILFRYSRKEYSYNQSVYSESVERRYRIRSNIISRVYRSVYG